MTQPDIRRPDLLVLRSRIWLEELSQELERLGHDKATAERSARNVLVHVVSRAQWPRQSFLAPDEVVD